MVGAFIDVIDFNYITDIMELWIPMLIFSVVGIIFYVVTCILYEKKVHFHRYRKVGKCQSINGFQSTQPGECMDDQPRKKRVDPETLQKIWLFPKKQ